jgi:hypothetical protein
MTSLTLSNNIAKVVATNDDGNDDNSNDLNTDNYCLICCDDFDNNKTTLTCNHSFHYDCLKLSLKCSIKNKKECPYCLAPIASQLRKFLIKPTKIKCSAMTMKGLYCLNTSIENGLCKIHSKCKKIKPISGAELDNKNTCKGITKKGNPCTYKGKYEGYCGIHNPKKK